MPSIFCRFFKVIGEDLDTVVLTVNCIRPSQRKNIQFLWGLLKLFLLLLAWSPIWSGNKVFSSIFCFVYSSSASPHVELSPLAGTAPVRAGGSLQWRLRQEEQCHHFSLRWSSVSRGPFFHKVTQIVPLLIPEALRDCFTITFYMRSTSWLLTFLIFVPVFVQFFYIHSYLFDLVLHVVFWFWGDWKAHNEGPVWLFLINGSPDSKGENLALFGAMPALCLALVFALEGSWRAGRN